MVMKETLRRKGEKSDEMRGEEKLYMRCIRRGVGK
jgi:hypothetical protein